MIVPCGGDDSSGSIKSTELTDWMRSYQLIQKDAASSKGNGITYGKISFTPLRKGCFQCADFHEADS
jgi:hypothetical protein